MWPATILVAAAICLITFYAKGGLTLETMTTAEIVITLVCGALVAASIVLLGAQGRMRGRTSIALMLAFTALTAASVVWSVAPSSSWIDANRMLAFSAVLAAAIALVAIAPDRWPALLGGITLAAVVVCSYALLTKIFPASLAGSNTFARLEEPFGYWNALGLMAAMGAVGCLWLGARRDGHAALSALAYPAMGVLLLTLTLAYSRGALAALGIAALLWLALVPLRLRGALLLLVAGVAAGGVAAYAFSTHALSSENVELAQRTSAGHRLGALTLAMVVVLAVAGVAIGFLTGRRPVSATLRRRAGLALASLVALVVLAGIAGLAHSHRGLTGSVSHAVSSLTDPNAKTPPNTPGRLTAVASVRARYWKEALEVFSAHPALGAGAMGYQTARLRYRTATLVVTHAHGFVVQTLADLGLVGLFAALALLASWLAAAGAATHPFNRRWESWRSWLALRTPGGPRPGWHRHPEPYGPERIGLLTMLCIVVCFGAHSLIDWTWYVPGDACVALLCAGWLAGRGPLASGGREAPRAVRLRVPRTFADVQPLRAAAACAVLAAALVAAWSQWQPQRSEDARQTALEQLPSRPGAALASARTAVDRDPLSAVALFTLATVQQHEGEEVQARATLAKAVREQPSNPQTWLELARFDLAHDPSAALTELRAAIFLDPQSIAPEQLARGEREAVSIYNDYVQALRTAG